MSETSDDNTSVKKSNTPLYLSILLLGGLVAAYFLIPQVENFLNEAWKVLTSDDEKRIKAWVDGFR